MVRQQVLTNLCLLAALVSSPIALAASLPVAQSPGQKQDSLESVPEDWLFQFELFQGLLEQSGLKNAAIDRVLRSPENSVIVLTGRMPENISARSMEQFCARGGHLLVACDSGFNGGRLAEFQRGPVVVRGNRNRYQNFEDCIVVSDFPDDHPTTRGVRQLVFNRTGWLTRPRWYRPTWRTLAVLPNNVSPANSQGQPLLLEVTVGSRGVGRLILTADHSLFTNGMLWHGDNALFAIQVAEWLAEGDRTQLLFINDGTTLSGFLNSPAFQPPENLDLPTPEIDLATLLNNHMSIVNNVVQDLQRRNVFNEFVSRRPRNMDPSVYRRWLMFALVAIVAAFAIWRFTATTYNYFAPTAHRPMKTALQLNQEELTRQDELSRAAGMLARDLCYTLTGSLDSRVWVQQLSKQSLNPRVTGLQKDERAQLGQIVALATNSRSTSISKKRLEDIGRMIRHFHDNHRKLKLTSRMEEQQRHRSPA